MRTLQTASQIARVFQIPEVSIDYQLHEALYPTLMDQNPESSLLIRKSQQSEISDKYLGGVSYVDPTDGEDLKYFKETFPEERKAVSKRVLRFGEKFAD